MSSASYIQNQIEQRERQWQTSFPAKVLKWNPDNTVQLEPQHIEVWRDGDERLASWLLSHPMNSGSTPRSSVSVK